MIFRNDINGLRAYAVIPVVLYHFMPSSIPGGFAGVDVFFVISGFLMTGIIVESIKKDRFSLLNFYISRANRIIPPLALLTLSLLVAGWFILPPVDYQTLGKHAASSIGFFSNIIYLSESGYFDASAFEKWLLHTWSLSVEWQFYIVFPIILVAIVKVAGKQAIKKTLITLTVISFLASLYASYYSPNAAYYLLIYRAWELIAGGLIYLYPIRATELTKKIFELTGICLILLSYLLVDTDTPWPSHFTLPSILGACLVLLAQRSNSLITTNYACQKIGSWSYSIYLWHWPFAVAINYFYLPDALILPGIFLSVFAGYLSYRYIETIKLPRTFKNLNDFSRFTPGYLLLGIIISGAGIYHFSPNSYRYPIPQSITNSIERKPYECFDKIGLHLEKQPLCTIGTAPSDVLVLGDSHAYSALPAFEALSNQFGFSFSYAGFSGCPPLLSIYPIRSDQLKKDCHQLNAKLYEHASSSKPKLIVLVARWTYYTQGDYSFNNVQHLSRVPGSDKNQEETLSAFKHGLNKTFEAYHKLDIPILVMLDIPIQETSPHKIYLKSFKDKKVSNHLLAKNSIPASKSIEFQRKTNRLLLMSAERYQNIHFLDPTQYFCKKGHCPVGNKESSFYFDDDHLSIIGSKKLAEPLTNKLTSLNIIK